MDTNARMEITSFRDFSFSPTLQAGLDAMGYEKPTEIQAQSIPIILQGHDLIGCAQTGTGKTAAFLLPIIDRLVKSTTPREEATVLVVVPTRELAMQIDQQVEGLGYFTGVSSHAIFGGNDSAEWALQKESLTRGSDILVVTPGRLIQFIQLGIARLESIRTLILDEADRMLDMGFMPDIERIVQMLPKERQTLLFSATMPKKVRGLAKSILHQPHEIDLAVSRPAENIRQRKLTIDAAEKIPFLVQYLNARQDLQSIIIFAERKVTVRDLSRALQSKALSVLAMHSDLDQETREEALRQFKGRQVRMLVATDIVARGIDIDNIELVVNYNVPNSPESYVHRVGRTARAEKDGESLTLVSRLEEEAMDEIEALLGHEVQQVELPEGIELPERKEPPLEKGKRLPRASRGNANRRRGSTSSKSQQLAKEKGTEKKTKRKKSPRAPRGKQAGENNKPQRNSGANPSEGRTQPQQGESA